MNKTLIVIVPGYAGSKLYCNCLNTQNTHGKRLYPRKYWFFNSALHSHLETCTNIITKPLRQFWLQSVYKKMEKKLNKNLRNTVKYYSYDWRQDPVNLALDLLIYLKTLTLERYTSLTLVGHSLGGFIIRILVEYFRGHEQLIMPSELIRVFQCGTPIYGSLGVNDYNYGFQLAAILASYNYFKTSCPTRKVSKEQISKIKPFLFSKNDLKRLVKSVPENLVYLLPTPFIFGIHRNLKNGTMIVDDMPHFDKVYKVHRILAEMSFPVQYRFFYNISEHKIEHVYVPFSFEEISNQISLHEISPGNSVKNKRCGIYIERLMKSDGLIVPFISSKKVPENSRIYVDESESCTHGLIMNSQRLLTLIDNIDFSTYFNQSFTPNFSSAPSQAPPSYQQIINSNIL